jgi:CrcB protein
LGGFFGAIARFALSGWVAARWGEIFPWGHLRHQHQRQLHPGLLPGVRAGSAWVHPGARLMFAVGFIGAYTPFSTYTYESFRLMMDVQFALAAFNIVGSVVVGLVAVFAGVALGSAV